MVYLFERFPQSNVDVKIESKIKIPPIEGVPIFCTCLEGVYSRIIFPVPIDLSFFINGGPKIKHIKIAVTVA